MIEIIDSLPAVLDKYKFTDVQDVTNTFRN